MELTCTRVLSIMTILCFMVQYMLRVTMPIAIVEMTSKNTTSYVNWNEDQQNMVLSSFFFGYMFFAIPGGRLSEIYGPRRVLGTCILLSSILVILTPVACSLHLYVVVAMRLITGLAMAVWFPALPNITARWIPPKDRSKFVSHSAAAPLGSAITLLFSGSLIARLGWESVFYVTGTIAIIFSFFWFYLVYDSPQQHPRISEQEFASLTREVRLVSKTNLKVPWKKLLTSAPVWAIVLSSTCMLFCWYFIFNKMPAYMKQVLNYEIQTNGIVSCLPHAAMYITSFISSYFADRWIRTGRFSVITTRKIFTVLTLVAPGVLFFIQTFWGQNQVVSMIVFTLAGGFESCYTAGIFPNSLDIAPAFSATILGIAICGGSLAGYLSTTLLGLAIRQYQDFQHWQIIFVSLGTVYWIGATIYFLCASGDVQSWNSGEEEEKVELRESSKVDE